MPYPTLIHLLVSGLLILGLTTCTSSSPLSATAVVPNQQTSAKARRLQARVSGLRTLAAVLTVTFANPSRRDTFDMIVNYDAAGKTRYTAFKDLILSTRPIFDLVFIDGQYRLITHNAGHTHQYQGQIKQFTIQHPSMRIFALVGEAFFLPGYDAAGRPPMVLNAAGTRFSSRLKSGLKAVWFTRSNSLEIISAQLDGKIDSTPVSLQLTYRDYRNVAAYAVPAQVTLIDPYQRLTTQAWVKQIEINTPLAAGVFDLSARPSSSLIPTFSRQRRRDGDSVVTRAHDLTVFI
jgi:hypothetical protein